MGARLQFEVVVSWTKNSTVFPLLASAATAGTKETQTFADKIDDLPEQTRSVSADTGYDSNHLGVRIEWTAAGKRTGRRFLCPENRRNSKSNPKAKPPVPRNESHRRRLQHRAYYRSRATYRRHSQTVEPFNEWFKSLFEFDERV